jgi:hypothetical protein
MQQNDDFTKVQYKKQRGFNDTGRIKILKKELLISQQAIGKYKKKLSTNQQFIKKYKEEIDILKKQILELLESQTQLEQTKKDLIEKGLSNEKTLKDYSSLKEDYSSLKEDYSSLKEDYSSLKDKFTKLEETLQEEKGTNFDLNKDISILTKKINDEKRNYYSNYPSPDGSVIKKKIYIIDVAKINIYQIDVRGLFNYEYQNLFTQGYFHWALPKDKRVGDIVIIKDSNQGIDIMVRIFNTFPITNYYPDYGYLGTVCMACVAAN